MSDNQRIIDIANRLGTLTSEGDAYLVRQLLRDLAVAIREDTLTFVREDTKLAVQSAPNPSRKSAAEELNDIARLQREPLTLCAIHARYFANHLIGPGACIPFEKDGCCDWLKLVAHRR